MAADMIEIEEMLQAWATRISASIGVMIEELRTMPEPETRGEAQAREALVARIRGWNEYHERVEAQLVELRRERIGDPEEVFAGTFPPTDPDSLVAQWASLLDDMEELPSEYLGEGAGEEGALLFEAWLLLDAEVKALDPTDRQNARAILRAVDHDLERVGDEGFWEEGLLETARAHRGPPTRTPR